MAYYFEPNTTQLTTPPAVAGDLIVGRADGNFDRLAIGSNGSLLNISAGAIRWGNTIDSGGLTVTAGDVAITGGALNVGSTTATTGKVNLPNLTYVAWRNAANTGDIGIRVNASNIVALDPGLNSSGASFGVAPVSIGSNPATTGTSLNLADRGSIGWRNAANTFDMTIRYNDRVLEIDPGQNGVSVKFFQNFARYNNVATAGWGVAAINGYGRATGQVAANASVATFTPASDASFIVSGNVLVTASTTHSFQLECAYTDEGGTARVVTFNVQQLGGTLVTSITNITGLGPYEGVPLHIRVKGGNAITIRTNAGGTYTSVTYNAEGAITQIA